MNLHFFERNAKFSVRPELVEGICSDLTRCQEPFDRLRYRDRTSSPAGYKLWIVRLAALENTEGDVQ